MPCVGKRHATPVLEGPADLPVALKQPPHFITNGLAMGFVDVLIQTDFDTV